MGLHRRNIGILVAVAILSLLGCGAPRDGTNQRRAAVTGTSTGALVLQKDEIRLLNNLNRGALMNARILAVIKDKAENSELRDLIPSMMQDQEFLQKRVNEIAQKANVKLRAVDLSEGTTQPAPGGGGGRDLRASSSTIE